MKKFYLMLCLLFFATKCLHASEAISFHEISKEQLENDNISNMLDVPLYLEKGTIIPSSLILQGEMVKATSLFEIELLQSAFLKTMDGKSFLISFDGINYQNILEVLTGNISVGINKDEKNQTNLLFSGEFNIKK